MKLPEITKRDNKVFFLGVLFMLLFELIYDWKEVKRAFNERAKAAEESAYVVGNNTSN